MTQELWTNNASTTLASGISSSTTSITVATGTGALFPAITGTNYFYATLQPAHTLTPVEIVLVTAISTDTLTVVRAQQGTTASAYSAGDIIENRITAYTLENFPQLIASETISGAWNYTTRPTVGGNNVADIATAQTWTAAQTHGTAGAPEIYNVGNAGVVYEYAAPGYFASSSSTATGDIKIALPVSVSFSDRISMVIAMYDGTAGYSEWNIVFTGNVSGTVPFKNYDSAGTSGGGNSYCTIMGNAPSGSVRFGYDSSHPCIVLGATATVYNKPIVYVKSITGDTSGWGAGVTITQITSESGITFAGSTYPGNVLYTNIAGTMTAALNGGTVMSTGATSPTVDYTITVSGPFIPFFTNSSYTTLQGGSAAIKIGDVSTPGKTLVSGSEFDLSSGVTFNTSDPMNLGGDVNLTGGVETFTNLSSIPSAPTTGLSKVFAKTYATRSYPMIRDAVGWAHALQPAFSHGTVALITAGAAGTPMNIGPIGISAQSGTASTPTPGAGTYGLSINVLSAATTSSVAGIQSNATGISVFLTSTDGYSGGFYFTATCFFPDASYGSGSTGTRIYVGVSDSVEATTLGADSPTTTNSIGFGYSTNAADTTWHFLTANNGAGTRTNTSMTFAAQNLFRFYIYAPPGTSTIYWQVDNITAGSSQSGSVTATLPSSTIQLNRFMTSLITLSNTARNIGFKQIYVETPQ